VGEDPDVTRAYLGSIAETMMQRDEGTEALISVLLGYVDTMMIGLDGKKALCLAKRTNVGEDESGFGLHPFQIVITSSTDGGGNVTYKYYVHKGTIIDGTNGAVLPIDGLNEEKDPQAGIVCIEGNVGADLSITGLQVVMGEESTKEVEMNASSPPEQIKINLVIGKITMDTTVTPNVPTAWQGWTSSAMAVNGFLNGSLVKVFAAAPTDSASI
jgi:hypothetical protein